MNTLKLNDREIHSLAELRADVEITQLMAAFLNESLEKWLSDCYYERESYAVIHLSVPSMFLCLEEMSAKRSLIRTLPC